MIGVSDQFVGLANYTDLMGGFGISSAFEVQELQKALTTGQDIVGAGAAGGQALRVQSLENTLKLLTYRASDLALWQRMAKKTAFSTVEEYSRLDKLAIEMPAFVGENPDQAVAAEQWVEQDQSYSRQVATVRFMAIKKAVTLAATFVRNIVQDIEAHQTQIGTLELLGRVEAGMFYSDNRTNLLAWDGYPALMEKFTGVVPYTGTYNTVAYTGAAWPSGDFKDIIIDCEGNPLSEEYLELGQQITRTHFGKLDVLYMSPRAKSDLAKQLFPAQRQNMPPTPDGRWGINFNFYMGSNGESELLSDVFIGLRRPKAAGDTGAPSAPANGSNITIAAASQPSSKMEIDTYYYYLSSIDRQGRESATTMKFVAVTATGYKVTLSILTGSWQTGAIQARVYRSKGVDDITKASLIATLPKPDASGTIAYVDENQSRENCSIAMGFTWDSDQVVAFKQLAPLMKLPLAIVSTAKPFLILLYGTPVLYAPSKCISFRNVGMLT